MEHSFDLYHLLLSAMALTNKADAAIEKQANGVLKGVERGRRRFVS